MSTNKTVPLPIVVLKLPRRVASLVAFAQHVVASMTANPAFTMPDPPLAELTSATGDLLTAESTALTRARGTAAIRDEKRAALATLLRHEAGYVQRTGDLNVENAVSIIESAGMSVKKTAGRKPRAFEALQGPVSGSAKLVTKSAGGRASYEWQSSTDGGKTWVIAPATMQAKTVILGLTPGATAAFRYRTVTKDGEGDFSQVVTLMVR